MSRSRSYESLYQVGQPGDPTRRRVTVKHALRDATSDLRLRLAERNSSGISIALGDCHLDLLHKRLDAAGASPVARGPRLGLPHPLLRGKGMRHDANAQ
jgi:hypothetical protein